MKIILGVIVLTLILFLIIKKRSIRSRYLPQKVDIKEYDNPNDRAEHKILQKGYNLTLSREMGKSGGYHLFLTLDTNGKDLTDIKKIIISWSEWQQRNYSFNYFTRNDDVTILDDIIRIDIGSFNNCPSSKNFLKRTVYSKGMEIDLLDYEPSRNDFSYENNYDTQSVFLPVLSKSDLKKFSKGRHYIDS